MAGAAFVWLAVVGELIALVLLIRYSVCNPQLKSISQASFQTIRKSSAMFRLSTKLRLIERRKTVLKIYRPLDQKMRKHPGTMGVIGQSITHI